MLLIADIRVGPVRDVRLFIGLQYSWWGVCASEEAMKVSLLGSFSADAKCRSDRGPLVGQWFPREAREFFYNRHCSLWTFNYREPNLLAETSLRAYDLRRTRYALNRENSPDGVRGLAGAT